MQPNANDREIARYLKTVADRYGVHSVKVGSKHIGATITSPISGAYIPLRLRQLGGAPAEQTSSPLLSDRAKKNRAAIIQAIQSHPLIVILGDAGSGKSTLLRYLALHYAANAIKGQPYVPFFVTATDLSTLPNASSSSLIELIPTAVRTSIPVGNVAQIFELALANGKALVLIDGLDEVSNASTRGMIATKVEDFVSYIRGSNNRSILTSRKVGYASITDVADLTAEFEIEEFEDEDVIFYIETIRKLLLEKRKLELLQAGAIADANFKLDRLRQLLFESSAIRELARSPLTLTLMCDSRIKLDTGPTHIGDLLEQLISTTLTPSPRRRQSSEHTVTDAEIVGFCQFVAANVHVEPAILASIDVPRMRSLHDAYSEGRKQHSASFSEIVSACEGLLVENGMNQYAFSHLAFQEYFAARNLASISTAETILDEFGAKISQAHWQNYCQMVAYCVSVVRADNNLTAQLLAKCFSEARLFSPNALSLLETLIVSLHPQKVPSEFKAAVQTWLASQERNAELDVRARCLSALGAIGDVRSFLTEVSDMRFVSIAGGALRLNATGDQSTRVGDFCAGQWTVTNSQFQQFVDDGYQTQEFWTERGWVWFNSVRRSRPMVPSRFSNLNQPVIAVSWHEANAFARWITSRAISRGWIPSGKIIRLPTEIEWLFMARGGETVGCHVAPLCQLTELVKTNSFSANPNYDRRFPWGDGFVAGIVNSAEANFAYPLCAGVLRPQESPYGAEMLAGNVWEWLTTAWGREWANSSYPLRSDHLGDDRDNLQHPDEVLRMVKGGSFMDHEGRPHFDIDYRTRNRPDGRYTNHGFRLIVTSSESLP